MSSKKIILVTGATGLLGPYIIDEFNNDYEVFPIGHSKGKHKVDLTNYESTKKLLGKLQPDIIINLAAYTNVEGCEKNPEIATKLNVDIPKNLVANINKNSLLIQISTDQVYGDTAGPHNEKNPAPVNTYSQTKLDGETVALKHKNTLVLRTNIFGKSRTKPRESISDFFIENMQKKETLKLFGDAIFSPLHMQTLAEIIRELINKKTTGIYNAGSNQALSKADFALEIAKHFSISTKHVEIVKSNTFKHRTKRPLDVSLNVTKIEKILGHKMPTLINEIKKL